MPRPQVSVLKRQREMAKREKQQAKADRKAQRKQGIEPESDMAESVRETPLED